MSLKERGLNGIDGFFVVDLVEDFVSWQGSLTRSTYVGANPHVPTE